MSARRDARGRDVAALVTDAGDVPRALLVGRCVEVWADDDARSPWHSARLRFSAARFRWLPRAGVERISDQQRLIPNGGPYSAAFLIRDGHADWLAERFAGCTVDDIPDLRAEAIALLELTKGELK